MTQVVGDSIFARWAKLIDEPELVKDPRFHDDMARGTSGQLLSERMAIWCRGKTTDQAMSALGEARIPAGQVLAPSQVMAHPQVHALGHVERIRYPGTLADAPVMGTPISLSAAPRTSMQRAPQAGEHTAEILDEIGYSADDVAELLDAGIVQIR